MKNDGGHTVETWMIGAQMAATLEMMSPSLVEWPRDSKYQASQLYMQSSSSSRFIASISGIFSDLFRCPSI